MVTQFESITCGAFNLRKNIYNLLSFKFFFINIVFGLLFGLAAANDQGLNTPIEISQLNLKLTTIEKTWLKNHPSIQIGGPRSFPPFHYFEKEGDLQGISADYITTIMGQLGVKVEVHKNLPWPEVLKRARSGEIDLIPCIAKTSEREDFLSFSSPYLSFPLVIISRKDSFFIGGIEDLHDKKLATIKKVSTNEWLKRDGVNFFPYYVDSPLKALESVSLGQADARIENLAAATYLIQKNGLTNLKVAAPTPYGNYDLHMAVGKNSLGLLSIINKALETIPPEKHMQIRNKWLSVRFEYGINKAYVAKWVFGVAGVAALIIGLILFWNRRLKTEVTYRKKIEEELLTSENRLQATLDATPFPIAVIDLNNDKIFYWSSSALKLFGRTASTVAKWYQIAYPDPDYRDKAIERWNSFLDKSRESGEPINAGEYLISCKEGPARICELYATFLSDALIVTFNDITERKLVENSLLESEARFKALHNASFGGIAIHDKGVILDCNKGMSEMTGYSITELIGMDGLLLIAQELRNAVMNNIVSGYEKPYESTGLRKSGEEFPIRIEAKNVPYKGKNVRVVEFRDITEQKLSEIKHKQLQTQLTQSQKMESIGRLAGGIAHDFNNILSGILGFSQLAKNHLNNPERAGKNIEQAIMGARKAAELVSQILTFSRKSAHEKQPLAIYIVIKDALKLLRASIPASIEIQEMIVSKATVMADPTKVHQVLMNLCTNAYHAMLETGGVLTVGLKNVEFSVKDCISEQNILPGKYLRLEISDTGHGMDVITKEKIFEPYFTTKMPDKGTGLGLAVVFGIIKEHDGYINVYSEPDHGSTFHVYFPIIEKAPEPYIAEEKEEAPTLGMETILFVDDEEAVLKTTQELLQGLGYIINPIDSGTRALEIYSKNPNHFDLVITDMTMPKMSGFELSQKILELRPEQPIILCTGHSELVNKEKALAIGIRQYFKKPILIKELSKVIRMVLDDAKGKTL